MVPLMVFFCLFNVIVKYGVYFVSLIRSQLLGSIMTVPQPSSLHNAYLTSIPNTYIRSHFSAYSLHVDLN